MGIFPGFGVWINQNTQQPLKAESLEIDHVKSMPLSATDPKYYDFDELARQDELWNYENKKHPWKDAPAKVKVKTKKGICHLNIDFILGSPPQAVFEMFTDPRNIGFFRSMGKYKKHFRTRLDTTATKILNKDGPRQITEVEKVLRWKILGYNGAIPIHLIIDENHQKVTGSWKIQPLFVDQERLCKSRSRISEEKYKKCSGGKGRIGSKLTMEHIFQPSPLLNVPPVSWFIRGITVKVTKTLLRDLREHVKGMNNMKTVDPEVYAKVIEEAESLEIDHVRSMPLSATDPKYYDFDELARQSKLWNSENKKHPWKDAPAKVKVKTKKGICHLNMDFILGSPPQAVFEMFTNPRSIGYFQLMGKYNRHFRTRLDTRATKVLKKDGPRQITEVEKVLRWKILGYNGAIPIHLIIDENHQKVTATYKKVKVKHMKVFEGSWKIQPLFVDQERLCKSRSRISEEKYKKCSGGKGRIGSKVTMEHIFQPSPLLNVPPVSWFIRGITVKVTKTLLRDLREHVKGMNNMKTVDPEVYAKVIEEVKQKEKQEKLDEQNQ
ncbi:unnamed protein product [Eruca vesicaria subsp. sativa]|uniref:DUF220 domain-containing protein n=1 Tax=Eruca vesicaria subsp. sativa TaxID=29727 RepID=A0ABC8J435_ERUVS|nr:unnamed protein product [Eruca vesicaria subsp. sativa]